MAITGTDRGTGTHNTSALSFTLSPASNLAAGSWAVLVIAVDNADTSGAAHSTFTVTDSLGNTWTRRISPLYDPGTASSGVEGAIFTTPQNGGTLTTGTTITVTFDASTTAKAWTLMEVVPSSGFYLKYVTGGVNTGSATTTPTVTTGSIDNGNIVIGGLFNEQGTGQTVTGDGDTTNGSWSTQQTAEVGTTAAGMTVSSQRKVVTATATQTFNPTLGVSSDVILGWIQLTEAKIVAMAQRLTRGVGAALLGMVMAAPDDAIASAHDLHAYRQPAAQAVVTGQSAQPLTQLVIVDGEHDARRADHGSRLLFGRAAPAPVVARWPLWQRPPVRIEAEEQGQAKPVDLTPWRGSYAHGRVPLVETTQLVIVEAERDASRTDHAGRLFFYRAQAPAPSGVPLWRWPQAVADQAAEPNPTVTDHAAALYPFRPHEAIAPPVVLPIAAIGQLVIVEADQDAKRTNHSAGLFFNRSAAVAPAQPITGSTVHPQDEDAFEVRPDHETFFRYQRPAITAQSGVALWRWPPSESGQEVEPNPTVTDHAAALYPFRPHEAVEPAPAAPAVPVAAVTQLVIVEAEQDARRTFHAAGLFFNRVAPPVPSRALPGTVHPQDGDGFEVFPDHETFFRYPRPAVATPRGVPLWFWPAAKADQATEPNPVARDHAAVLFNRIPPMVQLAIEDDQAFALLGEQVIVGVPSGIGQPGGIGKPPHKPPKPKTLRAPPKQEPKQVKEPKQAKEPKPLAVVEVAIVMAAEHDEALPLSGYLEDRGLLRTMTKPTLIRSTPRR
jgi:hypothetical protein